MIDSAGFYVGRCRGPFGAGEVPYGIIMNDNSISRHLFVGIPMGCRVKPLTMYTPLILCVSLSAIITTLIIRKFRFQRVHFMRKRISFPFFLTEPFRKPLHWILKGGTHSKGVKVENCLEIL